MPGGGGGGGKQRDAGLLFQWLVGNLLRAASPHHRMLKEGKAEEGKEERRKKRYKEGRGCGQSTG